MFKKSILVEAIFILVLLAACASPPASTPPTTVPASTTPVPTSISSPATTPPGVKSQYQLEYLLLEKYPDYFWCDPDFYPIGRPGGEQANSLSQFPAIQANAAEFSAILEHLKLADKADYSDGDKLNIYREHKKFTVALQTTVSGAAYQFVLRTGQNQGFRIEGTITASGIVTETKRETSFNTCPICLARGTLIETPNGPLPVEKLQIGMPVWTFDATGRRLEASVIKTASTPVPPSFQMLRINLADGRTIMASPGHPTSELKALGEYRPGDFLDGAQVIAVEQMAYEGEATFDILPSGSSGLYRANGILLLSTLK